MQEKLNLFKKTIKMEDGSKFDTYFMTNEDGDSIKTHLTDTAKADILKSGINFPMSVILDDENYFITTDTYTNPNGEKVKVPTVVITSFTKIEKANLEKRTISDVFKARKENKQEEIKEEDLPF